MKKRRADTRGLIIVFVLVHGLVLCGLADHEQAQALTGLVARGSRLERRITNHESRTTTHCVSCHAEVKKTHPGKYLTHHPTSRFSCTVCHEGNAEPSDAKSAHANIRYKVKPFLALDDPEYVEKPFLTWDSVQSACLKCHEDVRALAGAPLLARGAKLFNVRPCFGCHIAAGLGEERKPGPDLTNVGLKTSRQWIVRWLKNPQAWLANARMPNFLLSDREANAIADYLLSLTDKRLPEVAWEPYLLKPPDELTDEEYDEADHVFERGKVVWGDARCSACHNVAGVVGAFEIGPDLNRVAKKVNRDWLVYWLKDPRRHYPDGLMPRFRLSDEDAKALVYYIKMDDHFNEEGSEDEQSIAGSHPPATNGAVSSSQWRGQSDRLPTTSEGQQLVTYYGCAGCHAIKGHETDLKIGPVLTDVGRKALKHFNFKNLKHDRETWLRTKLTTPRFFTTPQRNMRMPDFQLSRPEVTALTTLLLSLTDEKVPGKFKVAKAPPFQPTGEFARLLGELKCTTCHTIRGTGGGFAPDLSWEGSKLKKEWVRRFIKSPDIIRPMLQQMPRLYVSKHWEGMPVLGVSDKEVRAIVDYIFSELVTDRIPRGFLVGDEPTEAQIQEGRAIYQKKGCVACHQIGTDGGIVGPDLTAARDRLQPGYIFALLKNPQAFDRDIVMPNYGLDDEEATALTRFLMTLKTQGGGEE